MSQVTIDQETLNRLHQLAAVGEVSAGVSHETRNLVTAITGFAQVARQRAAEPDAALRYIGMIEREALRCIELLERFLDLSRTDAGATELVDVARLLEHVASAASHSAEIGRLDLHVEVSEGLEVRGRRGELQQVILNLLINAIQATPAGGTITLSAKRVDSGCELAVTDTGPGVPEDVRAKIFDAFFSTKPAGKGTGLGLALCRRLVAAHAGTLELDSQYTRGARFVVRLPAS